VLEGWSVDDEEGVGLGDSTVGIALEGPGVLDDSTIDEEYGDGVGDSDCDTVLEVTTALKNSILDDENELEDDGDAMMRLTRTRS
jgi:hypothetical protein